jgi:hypothetical protein
MMASESTKSGGIGFLGLLTILFIGLKLTGYIQWSWLMVLSPLWLPLAIFVSLLGFIMIASALIMSICVWMDKEK